MLFQNEKIILPLSAEDSGPDESCRIETNQGEIQGQKTDSAENVS